MKYIHIQSIIMDIYSLVQKLPEDLVRVIASYDPTKELKRKQLKKSFEGIHHTAKWKLNIRNHIGNQFRIQKFGATIWDVIQVLVVCCCFGCYTRVVCIYTRVVCIERILYVPPHEM